MVMLHNRGREVKSMYPGMGLTCHPGGSFDMVADTRHRAMLKCYSEKVPVLGHW